EGIEGDEVVRAPRGIGRGLVAVALDESLKCPRQPGLAEADRAADDPFAPSACASSADRSGQPPAARRARRSPCSFWVAAGTTWSYVILRGFRPRERPPSS